MDIPMLEGKMQTEIQLRKEIDIEQLMKLVVPHFDHIILTDPNGRRIELKKSKTKTWIDAFNKPIMLKFK